MSAVTVSPRSEDTLRSRPVQGLIELAAARDWPELSALEEASFEGDRISARSWRRLLRSASAIVTVMRVATAGGGPAPIIGAAVVLRRKNSSVARLYSIALSSHARGRGLSQALLQDAINRMCEAGAAVLRLETRVENVAAQTLFSRCGFVRCGRSARYYEDGADALKFQKSLWNVRSAEETSALQTPFYAQTLDFTCGPCALLMAMAAIDPATPLNRVEEIRLWREATTVFMAAGHGGCGPHGLAAAAERRGFRTIVYAPDGKAMFVDSVRDPRKKAVIELVEADFRSELATTRSTPIATSMTAAQLVAHLRQGRAPIVLISLWRLHGEKGPHWVVVTGFDGHVFRILDPMAPPMPGALDMTITVDEFHRITRYGRRRHAAAVVLYKET